MILAILFLRGVGIVGHQKGDGDEDAEGKEHDHEAGRISRAHSRGEESAREDVREKSPGQDSVVRSSI